MDRVDFKELTMAAFWESVIFSFIFMLETCVYFHFDIWNKTFSTFSKVPPYDLAHFSNLDLTENLKNEPNHKGDL